MTEFKVGDVVVCIDKGDQPLINGKSYTVSGFGLTTQSGTIIFVDGVRVGHFDYRFKLKENIKPEIKVGSTYLTPTGLKRKVVFTDEHGSLADCLEYGGRKWYNPKQTGGWTLVPPEEWVNIQHHGNPRVYSLSSKSFPSEAAAKADLISGESSGAFYVRSVRVDANYNTSSV